MRGIVVPERTEDFTADPVELFFDLAFVFAFSQLVSHLVHHPDWTGVGEAVLLFSWLWLVWSQFTWSANAVSGNGRTVRALFLVATAASVPMAAAVGTAFDDGGPVFAIPLGVILLMGIGTISTAYESGSAELRSAVRYSWPNVLAVSTLIAGSFLDDELRVAAWLLGIAISTGATIAAGEGDWVVRSGHFAERHGLIVIIALGEVVVAIGIPVVESLSEGEGVPSSTIWALAAAGAFAGLLWWTYFDRPNPALELRAEALEGRELSRYVRDVYTYAHIAIVGGVILSAAALEEVTLHPKDPLPQEFRLMLLGGLVLYLGGVVIAVARAFRAMAWERLAFAGVIAAVLGAASSWDAVALLIVIDLVLLAVVVTEHIRWSGRFATRPSRERCRGRGVGPGHRRVVGHRRRPGRGPGRTRRPRRDRRAPRPPGSGGPSRFRTRGGSGRCRTRCRPSGRPRRPARRRSTGPASPRGRSRCTAGRG